MKQGEELIPPKITRKLDNNKIEEVQTLSICQTAKSIIRAKTWKGSKLYDYQE